jgi:hypothetical protein
MAIAPTPAAPIAAAIAAHAHDWTTADAIASTAVLLATEHGLSGDALQRVLADEAPHCAQAVSRWHNEVMGAAEAAQTGDYDLCRYALQRARTTEAHQGAVVRTAVIEQAVRHALTAWLTERYAVAPADAASLRARSCAALLRTLADAAHRAPGPTPWPLTAALVGG